MFNENEVMRVASINAAIFGVLALCLVGIIAFLVFVVGQFGNEVENQTGAVSLEDRCTFVVKTNGESFNISEPTAGTFKYELYATPDGFVEVWKCK